MGARRHGEEFVSNNERDPIVMTRYLDLPQGDFLSTLDVDGFLVDGRLVGEPAELMHGLGPEVVVAAGRQIRFSVSRDLCQFRCLLRRSSHKQPLGGHLSLSHDCILLLF